MKTQYKNELFISSELLKLEIYKKCSVNYGFSEYLGKKQEILVPVPDVNNYIIKLVNKDKELTFKELRLHLLYCRITGNKRMKKEATKYFKIFKKQFDELKNKK